MFVYSEQPNQCNDWLAYQILMVHWMILIDFQRFWFIQVKVRWNLKKMLLYYRLAYAYVDLETKQHRFKIGAGDSWG